MQTEAMELAWVVVKDLNEAIRYYKDILGMRVLEVHEGFGWAEVQGQEGGLRLGLAQMNDVDGMAAGSNAIITLRVKDIESARNELKEQGVTLIGEVIEVPGHVKLQSFSDLDGNRCQLVQAVT